MRTNESVSPILVQLKQEKSSFSGFFSQFVMSSSENRANSENFICTGGLKCLILAEGAQKVGEFSCYFSNPPAQRLTTLVSHSEANPKNN